MSTLNVLEVPKTSEKYVSILKNYAYRNLQDLCENNKLKPHESSRFKSIMQKFINRINVQNADKAYVSCIDKMFEISNNLYSYCNYSFNKSANAEYNCVTKNDDVLDKQPTQLSTEYSDTSDHSVSTDKYVDKLISAIFGKEENTKDSFVKKEEKTILKNKEDKKMELSKIVNVSKSTFITTNDNFSMNLVKGYYVKNRKTNTMFIVKATKLLEGQDGKLYSELDRRTKEIDVSSKVNLISVLEITPKKTGKVYKPFYKPVPEGINLSNNRELEIFKKTINFVSNMWKH